MASLFTDDEKNAFANCLADVHDTFKQDVYVFIEEASSVGVDTNYNPLYGRYKDQARVVTDKVLTKHTIEARVKYFKKGEEDLRLDIGLPSTENVIRLKVTSDGKEKLKNAVHVEVDGNSSATFKNNIFRARKNHA